MTVTRRQAREWAVQMLTAAELNVPADAATMVADFWAQLDTLDREDGGLEEPLKGKIKEFSTARVLGVLEHLAELDELLKPFLVEWPLDRLGTVERAVLRLGAWELKYSDVPTAVVINEAIDLVNWFSSPRSRHLVNAVLDSVSRGVRQ